MTALLAEDGGPQVDLTRFLTPQVTIVLIVAVLILVLLLILGVWMTARAARRRGWLNRDVVERGILTVKAQALPPGPARELAGMRLQLRAAGDQTRRTLEEASTRGCPIGELPDLLRRVEHVAEALDAEIQLLEGGADAARTRAAVPAARQRSDEILQVMERIRRAVAGTQADLSADELRSVQGDLDTELSALQAGVAAMRNLGRPGP